MLQTTLYDKAKATRNDRNNTSLIEGKKRQEETNQVLELQMRMILILLPP